MISPLKGFAYVAYFKEFSVKIRIQFQIQYGHYGKFQ